MKLIADTHTHTIASTHAFSTITENAAAAKLAGLKCIAMTDHCVDMPDAPHLWHFYSMRNIPRVLNDIYILRGVEANIINFNGDVDIYDNDVYKCLDWIIASFHHPVCLPSTKAEHTRAYVNLLNNPNIDCLGHVDTDDFNFDHAEIAKCAKANNKVIEINNARCKGHKSVERYKEILEQCAKYETKIIINTDAHFSTQIGDFEYALRVIDDIKYPEELIVNSSWDRFVDYINSRKNNLFNEFLQER